MGRRRANKKKGIEKNKSIILVRKKMLSTLSRTGSDPDPVYLQPLSLSLPSSLPSRQSAGHKEGRLLPPNARTRELPSAPPLSSRLLRGALVLQEGGAGGGGGGEGGGRRRGGRRWGGLYDVCLTFSILASRQSPRAQEDGGSRKCVCTACVCVLVCFACLCIRVFVFVHVYGLLCVGATRLHVCVCVCVCMHVCALLRVGTTTSSGQIPAPVHTLVCVCAKGGRGQVCMCVCIKCVCVCILTSIPVDIVAQPALIGV
jgi:hypothetical protein